MQYQGFLPTVESIITQDIGSMDFSNSYLTTKFFHITVFFKSTWRFIPGGGGGGQSPSWGITDVPLKWVFLQGITPKQGYLNLQEIPNQGSKIQLSTLIKGLKFWEGTI